VAETWDVAIIGGGFYGLYLAQWMAGRGRRVVLLERDHELMKRASHANQARVHNGYHYPRSILTAVRSRVNFPRFVAEFAPAIDSSFTKVYAVARRYSRISADQFVASMRRVGAPVRPAPRKIAGLFDPAFVEGVYLAQESVFSSATLRRLITDRATRAGVAIRLNTEVATAQAGPSGSVRLATEGGEIRAGMVFCCSYAQLNGPGAGGGLPLVPLKHELTEMALVEVPALLRGLGVTVMDGPFFSLMPFPDRGLHTLSHVRYTPHAHWFDGPSPYRPAYDFLSQAERRSAFPHMVRDAARYLPAVADCAYRDSLWEVKTVLPRSETDDSRPILFRPDHGMPNYHLVMGGKIDNVYDVADEIARRFGWDS
jgi:glycine/D-amino acid oxidase-like deaminating enzyme